MKTISYVLPVFNESESIYSFHKSLEAALKKMPKYNFEIVYINDGSSDDSLEKLVKIKRKSKFVKIINFSRNFGHQAAITAGTDYAQGDAVVVMDTDLQDPPSVSIELIKLWERGFDIVYAQRKKRKDNIFKKVAIHIHYRLLRLLTDVEIPVDTGDYRLMDKKTVNVLRKFEEKNRYVRGLVPYLGFRQTVFQYDRDARHAGETKYPFSKLVKLSLDGITSFSTIPLKWISRLGFIMFSLAIVGSVYVFMVRILDPEAAVPGWAFTMIVIFLMSGIQFITLGVMGAYLGRIYKEVQSRPLYIISDIID